MVSCHKTTMWTWKVAQVGRGRLGEKKKESGLMRNLFASAWHFDRLPPIRIQETGLVLIPTQLVACSWWCRLNFTPFYKYVQLSDRKAASPGCSLLVLLTRFFLLSLCGLCLPNRACHRTKSKNIDYNSTPKWSEPSQSRTIRFPNNFHAHASAPINHYQYIYKIND